MTKAPLRKSGAMQTSHANLEDTLPGLNIGKGAIKKGNQTLLILWLHQIPINPAASKWDIACMCHVHVQIPRATS